MVHKECNGKFKSWVDEQIEEVDESESFQAKHLVCGHISNSGKTGKFSQMKKNCFSHESFDHKYAESLVIIELLE